MSFRKNDAQQMTFSDSLYGLTEREKKALEKSWAKVFADEVFPTIDEERFRVLYSEKDSRPNTPVNIIVGALVLKELFGLSDDEVVETLMFDHRFQYALHTTSFEEQPLSDKSLSRFRIHNHTTADPAVSASSITLRDGLSYPCAGVGLYLQQLTDWDSISLSDPFQVHEPVNIFSNTFHLADFLPDITNAELLSALAQFFGLSLYFDNIARRIQLDFFTDTLRADALDLSQYVTSRQRLDYSPSPRSVSFNALRQNLDTKNINPLPPVASRSQLPDATTHPAAICFVRNENTFLRSERESDDSPIYHWHPAFGNNLSLDILPPDTDPLSQPDTLQPPHIAVPNMRVADGQRIPKYLLEVNTKGSSPLLETDYDNLFSPILVQYRGRRRLQLQRSQSGGHSFVPSAFIEDANPTNFNPDGSVNPDFLSLTTSGQGSVGELFLRPYHDFMARQEKFRFQALVPAHLFLLIRQLLLPQDGPVASQLRWILIDGSRFLPSSITYEFSSADLVTVSIDCSRPHTTP